MFVWAYNVARLTLGFQGVAGASGLWLDARPLEARSCMKLYERIRQALFLSRPNRFIAMCRGLEGEPLCCHVKNTGRLGELLVSGAEVVLAEQDAPGRKTAFDLVAVYRDGRLFNIDSQAPNKIVGRALVQGWLGFVPQRLLPEYRQGDSRFDFAFVQGERLGYVEVKGVTLEREGLALFPDAPTQRGIKHLEGLARLAQTGAQAHAVFVLQFSGATAFSPNQETHPAFAEALRAARASGVVLHAVPCRVSPDGMELAPLELPILL